MDYKKIKVYRLLLVVFIMQTAFAFMGCEKKTEEARKLENGKLNSVAEDGVTAVKPPQGKEIVDGINSDYIVKENQEYNFETDYNNRIASTNRVTDINSGILIGDEHLLLYNKNLKKGQIFCGRPDCNHLTMDCASSDSNMFQYYDGEIYEIDLGTLTLRRRSMDATAIDTIGNLLTVENIEGSDKYGRTCRWIIHRGYIYYIYFYNAGFDEDAYYLNNSNCIFRKSLDGNDEPECIMPLTTGISPGECYLKAAGSYIYIGMGTNEADYKMNIYRYNTETDKVESFKDIDENIVYMNCSKDGFYYIKNGGEKSREIHYYDNKEHKKESLVKIEKNISSLYMDADYMYMYRETKVNNEEDVEAYIGIYDYSGNELDNVKLDFIAPEDNEEAYIKDHIITFLGSDDKYIYFGYWTFVEDKRYNIWGMPQDFYQQLMVIDKAKLKEGNLEYEIWGK